MSVDSITYRVDGAVATVAIERPDKRNALTSEMVEALLDSVETAGRDDDVKAVVLRSTGPVFCAGFDVGDPKNSGPAAQTRRADLDSLADKLEWPRRLMMARKPVIASIQGNCIGLGTHIVLGCDFAIASTEAGFGLPEERFGGVGASWVYPYLMLTVGPKRATDMVMTGRRVPAEEAAAIGLITRVVAADALDSTVAELGAALSTLSRDALAINRAARRIALEGTGYLSVFGLHAMNALSQLVHHEDDEFDFVRTSGEQGIRAAITGRNALVAGSWWGW